MTKMNKWLIFIAGGAFALALLGSILFLSTSAVAADGLAEVSGMSNLPLADVGAKPGGPGSKGGPGGEGRNGVMETYEENLAEALGITVDELNTAYDTAFEATLADAVADGKITREEADLMLAHRALKDYIDHDALVAGVLGISVEELQAARDEGVSLNDLIEEAGMDRETFQENLQAAYEAAVQQAVEDGVITQEQADEILSQEGHPGGERGGRGGKGH